MSLSYVTNTLNRLTPEEAEELVARCEAECAALGLDPDAVQVTQDVASDAITVTHPGFTSRGLDGATKRVDGRAFAAALDDEYRAAMLMLIRSLVSRAIPNDGW